jgi:Nickel responsive protein SCO4226-like
MPKFMVTHTLPKGFSRDQFSQVAAATQQDPNVKCYESFANLTEGKVFCYWEAQQPEALSAWFEKMKVPYDAITKLELIAEGAVVKDA